MEKIKRYRLGISRFFPATHPAKGHQTNFVIMIENALSPYPEDMRYPSGDILTPIHGKKLHTMRANYPLWEKRIKKVIDGQAVIELFYWTKSPYNSKKDGSKQCVFMVLDKDSDLGIQKAERITDLTMCVTPSAYEGFPLGMPVNITELAKNDGLSIENFTDWFKKYDMSKPMALIHFTSFRY